MIRRLILSVAVCLVCVTSRADITNDLASVISKLSSIDSQMTTLRYTLNVISSYVDLLGEWDEVVYDDVQPLCQSVITAIPYLLSDIHSLYLSVGDQLGNDVFQISSNVDAMRTNLIYIDANLAYAVDNVLQMLHELEEIREFGYSITETVQTISDSIDDDVLANQRRIITLLEDIGTMLNWGSDLQNMAEDLAYIRQVFESYANEVQQRLYHIHTYQRELNTSFTIPFSLSHIPSYTFPFYYAYTTLQSPTSPSDWQIDSTDYIYDGSVNGILEEIGRVLTHILEGDSNASFMLANIVKSLAHEEISEQSKRDEYMDSISTPLSSAQTAYGDLTGDDGSGVVHIDDRFATPANIQGGIKDSLPNMMDGFTSNMRNFFFPQLPATKLKFNGFNSFNHRLSSIEGSLGLQNFAWVFSGIRTVFGFIYLLSYLLLAFFCLRWAIRGYHFLLSIFAGAPSPTPYRS